MNVEKIEFKFIETRREGPTEIARYRCNALPLDMYLIRYSGNRKQRRAGFKAVIEKEFEIDGRAGRIKGMEALKTALKELGMIDLQEEIVGTKILGMPGI
jgi:hypothetical protein